ncbi:MAG TPA: 50S ribosomal protein L11 methyltransferase [Bacteriovoracaceae bacterium]|nr:50S ribosomal protein L11 methyltransferase [Bacteriovoracaceae bacterium]
MDYFWIVTVFHFHSQGTQLEQVEALALNDYEAMGVEEYSLSEAEVDAILGERSYSGGDLPIEVLDEVDSKVSGRPGNFRFFFSTETNAQGFHEQVQKEVLCESQVEKCPQEDWNAEWKKHYSPILVNEHLEILPSWHKEPTTKSRKQIYINPGMGFGTGSHETTFLCLKIYTEELLRHPFKNVLDFGSGSGILGLATLLFHPEARVDFYDIDPEANKNCFQNAELNNLADKSFRLLLPEVREKLQNTYDLVFANILESILMQEKTELIKHVKPSGHLILSGLLKHQVPGIIESYSKSGVKLVRHEEKGDWAALLFEREL